MARKYTKIYEFEPLMMAMREEGKTRREIAAHFGLEIWQVKDLITRYNRRECNWREGVLPKPKGRPRKDGQSSQKNEQAELKRLRMENELLRDFLHLAGRK